MVNIPGAIQRDEQPALRVEIGGSLVLQCPHETTGSERPVINWYKLTATGQVPLYRYDGTTGAGSAVSIKSETFRKKCAQ